MNLEDITIEIDICSYQEWRVLKKVITQRMAEIRDGMLEFNNPPWEDYIYGLLMETLATIKRSLVGWIGGDGTRRTVTLDILQAEMLKDCLYQKNEAAFLGSYLSRIIYQYNLPCEFPKAYLEHDKDAITWLAIRDDLHERIRIELAALISRFSKGVAKGL